MLCTVRRIVQKHGVRTYVLYVVEVKFKSSSAPELGTLTKELAS